MIRPTVKGRLEDWECSRILGPVHEHCLSRDKGIVRILRQGALEQRHREIQGLTAQLLDLFGCETGEVRGRVALSVEKPDPFCVFAERPYAVHGYCSRGVP